MVVMHCPLCQRDIDLSAVPAATPLTQILELHATVHAYKLEPEAIKKLTEAHTKVLAQLMEANKDFFKPKEPDAKTNVE